MGKVGIVTWHYYPNVGSMLQAYALSHYLSLQGHEAEFINYREFNRPKLEWLRAYLCGLDPMIPKRLSHALNYHFPHFTRKYLPQSAPIYSAADMAGAASRYDTVICGSDQIWAPSVFNPVYFLDFVKGNARKISYAASIGLPVIPNEKKTLYQNLLADFDAISVREDEGARLLKELGVEAEVVCDPTLLLSATEYSEILGQINIEADSYLFCYFLGRNPLHRTMARAIADRLGKRLVIYSAFAADMTVADIYVNHIGPRQFVSYIKDANFVVTDSFHGLAFSLIFRKNFYVVERFTANDANNQNSRIYNILRHTALEDRLLRDTPEEITPIDYRPVEPRLNALIEHSKTYLRNEII